MWTLNSYRFIPKSLLLPIMLLCLPESALASLADTIDKIKASIVGVGSYDRLGSPQSVLKGTGFVIAEGNLIVTNHHVITPLEATGNEELVIFVGQGRKADVRKVSVKAYDAKSDIAILEQRGGRLPAMILDNQVVREGESVAFTGFPIGAVLGLYPVTHKGIVSSITPIVIPAPNSKSLNASMLKRLRDPFMVYQLDATAYPGNSGSPLYNPETGQVIGVINKVFVKESKEAVLEKPSGITYAIPIKAVKDLLQRTQ